MALQLHETVTRLRAPLVSGPYGGQTRDWANATSLEMPALVHPLTSTEDVAGEQKTISRWRLLAGPEYDIEPTDRFEWDGDTYEVDGEVGRWKRHAELHHQEAVLMRVDHEAG